MNRLEVNQFLKAFFAGLENTGKVSGETKLKPFLDLVVSLKQNPSLLIPLLRDLSDLINVKDPGLSNMAKPETGTVKKRIERRYRRLCRVQEELGRLDFKQAAPGSSPEDYVFSKINFSRYREMKEHEFNLLFPGSLTDFEEDFLKKNLGLNRNEIKSAIEGSYKKRDGLYTLERDNPLVFSIMRTLETSLENSPLFSPKEIEEETDNLFNFTGSGKMRNTALLYPLLVSGLDNVQISHEDGMTTKLSISPEGDLAGTFRPGNKPWTLVLIKKEIHPF